MCEAAVEMTDADDVVEAVTTASATTRLRCCRLELRVFLYHSTERRWH